MLVSVTTCKGRLVHLRQTLRRLVAEVDRAIVVDWDCPDGSGDWAEQLSERVTVVRPDTRGAQWHKTRALNLGALRAFELGARVLCFADADTRVAAGFGAACRAVVEPGRFAIVAGRRRQLMGFLVATFADFSRAGGYDERFIGYGREDIDLRLALGVGLGCSWGFVPGHLLDAVPHGHELRTRFQSDSMAESEERAIGLLRRKWGPLSALPKKCWILAGQGRAR